MELSSRIQAEFLSALVQGSNLVDSHILEFIEPGYFSVDSYQWLVKKLKERNWEKIHSEFIDQLLLEDVPDSAKRAIWKEQIAYLYALELTFIEDAYKKFKTFLAYSVSKASIKGAFESFDRTKRIDYTLSELSEAVKKSEMIIQEDRFQELDYAASYKERLEKRLLYRDNPSLSPVIRTGIRGLDSQFDIKGPMIVGFLAPFKRYKSIMLNHMGFAALLQGFNVLHVVYENSIELTTDRYDSLFSQISFDRITSMAVTQEEKESTDRLFAWVDSWSARLKVIKCTPATTTMQDVETHVENMHTREQFYPDVVVVDYLNIMAPTVNRREERLSQAKIVWDIKAFVDKYNIPCITAYQAKMESVKSERLDMTHQGKSIDISQGVNLSIAINQTEDEQKEGILVLSPLFSREAAITIPEVVLDANLSNMSISKDLSYLWGLAARNYPYLQK